MSSCEAVYEDAKEAADQADKDGKKSSDDSAEDDPSYIEELRSDINDEDILSVHSNDASELLRIGEVPEAEEIEEDTIVY